MILDEAIKHEEEIVEEEQYEYQECVATHNMEGAMNCRKYAEEHRQLAEWLKDYKRVLEQQPCEDCISREDLKRKLQEYHDLYVNAYGGFSNLPLKEKARVDEITSCIAEVVNMPSVYSKPKTEHWIPVSERLPEESLNSVIGWDAHRERCVFVQYIDGYFQITGSDESFNIVAWMPLPEPYKVESEETK